MTDPKAQLSFDTQFLDRHAGIVFGDPIIAVVELVANAWDAGAARVELDWSTTPGDTLCFTDDGTGMTRLELEYRWRTLSYNRAQHQGTKVVFPPGRSGSPRRAFGANGIGRHAAFCFARSYLVETRKNGIETRARVERVDGAFGVVIEGEDATTETGTKISSVLDRQLGIEPDELTRVLGTKFIADPGFRIFVNGSEAKLADLDDRCTKLEVAVDGLGTLPIRRYDSGTSGRTSLQHGVAWWVGGRLVGAFGWAGLLGPILDARHRAAKRYTYIVEADLLSKHVKPNWTGFHSNETVLAARRAVEDFIRSDLHFIESDIRRQRQVGALQESKGQLKSLPRPSQEAVVHFAGELTKHCPTISERDLSHAVLAFVNMEKARTKFGLLERLANVEPADIDSLHEVLHEWTVSDVKKVLGELRYRLQLIRQLEKLVDDPKADELHEIQPLIEGGLWMFGPEFESVHFVANRWLTTVLTDLLGGGSVTAGNEDLRADIVLLPDGSIGVYACEAFDDNHEASGLEKILVIELKRAGIPIGYKQLDQARDYSRELLKGGKAGPSTAVVAYVLGSSVETDTRPMDTGNIRVVPRTYRELLTSANARTFHLLRHMEGFKAAAGQDDVLDEVFMQGELDL